MWAYPAGPPTDLDLGDLRPAPGVGGQTLLQGRGAYDEHDAKPYRWTYDGSPLKRSPKRPIYGWTCAPSERLGRGTTACGPNA